MKTFKPKTPYYDHWLHANGWDDDMLYEMQQFPAMFRMAIDQSQPGEYLYAYWCVKERPLPAVKHPISDEFHSILDSVNNRHAALNGPGWRAESDYNRYDEVLMEMAEFVRLHADKIIWRD